MSPTEALLAERSETHGDYEEFSVVTQAFKMIQAAGQRHTLSDEQQESLDMIFHKIARVIVGDPNVKDHWDDIAGYATLGSKSIKNDRTIGKGAPPSTSQEQVGSRTGAKTVPLQGGGRLQEALQTTPAGDYLYWQ